MILASLIRTRPLVPTLEQMDAVLEKVNTMSNFTYPQRVAQIERASGNNHTAMSTISDTIIDSKINHHVSEYEKEKYDLLLESKTICEDYRKLCEADFDYWIKKAGLGDPNKINEKQFKKFLKEYDHNNGYAWEHMMVICYFLLITDFPEEDDYRRKTGIGPKLTPEEAKRAIVDKVYYKNGKTDLTPKQVQLIIQARQAYVEGLVSSMQQMLEINYKILGLSKKEAEALSSKVGSGNLKSIEQVQNIIKKNKRKFVKKDRIDLRPLGYGVMYLTSSDLGAIERNSTLDGYFMLLMKYDCIILAHGGNFRLSDEEWLRIDKFIDDKSKSSRMKVREIAMNSKYPVNRWLTQPIYTDQAGPLVDVNEILRQVAREGNKNILIVSCNPGHHILAPDLIARRDITITHGMNSVMAESTQLQFQEDEITNASADCSGQLYMFSDEVHVDYTNDKSLVHAYESTMGDLRIQTIDDIVNEDVEDWGQVSQQSSNSMIAFIALFKTAMNYASTTSLSMKTTISNLVSGLHLKIFSIVSEGVDVKEVDLETDNLESFIMASNASIVKELNRVSKEQMEISKEIDKYITSRMK